MSPGDMERDEFVMMMIKELERQKLEDAESFERGWRPPLPSQVEARPVFDKLKFDFAEPDSTELQCLTQALAFHLGKPGESNGTPDENTTVLPDGWQLNHNFLFNLRDLATRSQPNTATATSGSDASTTIAEEASALAVVSLLRVVHRALTAQRHDIIHSSLAPLLTAPVAERDGSVALPGNEITDGQQASVEQGAEGSCWENVLRCVDTICDLVSYDTFASLSQERWETLDTTNTLLLIAKCLRDGQGGGVLNVEVEHRINNSDGAQSSDDRSANDVCSTALSTALSTDLRSKWPRFMFILRDRIIHRPASVATIVPSLMRFRSETTDEKVTPNVLPSRDGDVCDPMVVSILAELVRSADFARASSAERGIAWDILFGAREQFAQSFAKATREAAAVERRMARAQAQQQQQQQHQQQQQQGSGNEGKGEEVTAAAAAASAITDMPTPAERSARSAELSALVTILEFLSSGDPRTYGQSASRKGMDGLVSLGVMRAALTAWLALTETDTSTIIGRFLMTCARRSSDVALFLLKVPTVHAMVLSSEWTARSALTDRVLCPLTLACAVGRVVADTPGQTSDAVGALVLTGLNCAIDVLEAYTLRSDGSSDDATMSDTLDDTCCDANESTKGVESSSEGGAVAVREAMELLMALDDQLVVACLANGPTRVVQELRRACKGVEAAQRLSLGVGGAGGAVAATKDDEEEGGDGFRGKLELGDRHVRVTALVKRVLGRLDSVQGGGNKAD
jgi:hypothetical protein